MSNRIAIVEHFNNAYYSGDLQAARTHLADEFRFVGPGAEYGSADAYLKSSEHVAPVVKEVRWRKIVVDGGDVCGFFDLHLNHEVSVLPMAAWYRLTGDKICSIELFFDTAPFLDADSRHDGKREFGGREANVP